jgi:signal transduction histidine kinase
VDAFFTTRATVGTGIGLFVAKQFVEGRGGGLTSKATTNRTGTAQPSKSSYRFIPPTSDLENGPSLSHMVANRRDNI